MKRLDRYILTEHIAPFCFAFFVITFLLVIELVPKLVDNVIDKDLELMVVLELLGLNLAWMLALSVPMSVLVATLMAFGRLTSDFEVTAMKASGINVVRAIVPVLVAAGVIMAGMVYFNDQVLPDLNRRARLLWGDVSAMRPTLVFRSNAFITEIPGFLVLIDHIDHAASRVEGVQITDSKDPSAPRIVVAEYGYLEMTEHNTNMLFTLHNGEVYTFDIYEPKKDRKVGFESYVINVHDARDELHRTESQIRNDREMGIDEMRQRVANAESQIEPYRQRLANVLSSAMSDLYSEQFVFVGGDSLTDSAALAFVSSEVDRFLHQTQGNSQQIKAHNKSVLKYGIEIHKKYSIPAASLVFVILGAPLGVVSRRGGMGVAIAISILLFIVYWAFLIGGEDLADRGLVSPFWAMWSANILMGLMGIYLLYIVASEKPVLTILGFRGPRDK